VSERTIAAVLVAAQFTGIGIVAFGGPWPPHWSLAGLGIALALVAWSYGSMSSGTFTVSPLPRTEGAVTRHGPYRWVRHPMYLALLLAAAVFTIGAYTPLRAITAVGLLIVLVAKIRIEERALQARHPEYAATMAGVPRLLPLLW